MKNLLERLTFRQLIWLIPIFIVIHNLEEAPNMEKWAMEHLPAVPQNPYLLEYYLPISTTEFWVSTVLIDLFVFLLAFLCLRGQISGFGIYLMMGIQSIIFLNVFNHIYMSALFFQYQPGLVTGVLINLPFSVYLFYRAVRDNYIQKKTFICVFAFFLLFYPFSPGIFLVISKMI